MVASLEYCKIIVDCGIRQRLTHARNACSVVASFNNLSSSPTLLTYAKPTRPLPTPTACDFPRLYRVEQSWFGCRLPRGRLRFRPRRSGGIWTFP